ncbi:MAG: hypothetical protein M3P42_08330, partial [Actinomycetota bacterium]|nr:hypothetical protein [Actinomycetota bacterium]
FDLYDVTNPANPTPLVQGAGDLTPGSDNVANAAHSVFLWQDGAKAYAVIVDSTELQDVDIFDITNPRAPVLVGEHDFFSSFPQVPTDDAYLPIAFHHDVVVKQIGGRSTLLSSYWDAGYVLVDVTDPANPTYLGDTDFGGADPLTGITPPEGNASSAQFSWDGKFFLGGSDDSNPFRVGDLDIDTGSGINTYPAREFIFGGTSVGKLGSHTLNGPVVWGGSGCVSSSVPLRNTIFPTPLPAGEEATIVFSSASCPSDQKVRNGAAAGYDAVITASPFPDPFCPGAQDLNIPSVCTTSAACTAMFATPPSVGQIGYDINATAAFDGWGYTSLYEVGTGKRQRIDAAAISEAVDPTKAYGFGNLSVRAFATDPTEYLAYSSNQNGGMRVFKFGAAGLDEVGAFVAEGGSNFWGVEQFTTPQGDRLFAGSDRDFGLYLFRYTGPGAAQKPACQDTTVSVPYKLAVDVPLGCSDANANPLTRHILTNPSIGTVGAVNQSAGTIQYTHTGNRVNQTDSFTFGANDGAASSPAATIRMIVAARDGGRCFNPFVLDPGQTALEGSRFGDTVTGGANDETISGLGGSDCLLGLGGRDRLLGGADADQMNGGLGADFLAGGLGNDGSLRGGADRDRINGEAGNDGLFGESGNDALNGGAGNDRLFGGAGADSATGGSGADQADGGSGNDVIVGGGGADVLVGGTGNDRITANDGVRDRISCGSGRDRVVADRSDRIARGCERVRRVGKRRR